MGKQIALYPYNGILFRNKLDTCNNMNFKIIMLNEKRQIKRECTVLFQNKKQTIIIAYQWLPRDEGE